MAEDRKRRRPYDRFARLPDTSGAPAEIDDGPTPLPASLDQAAQWHHIDKRLAGMEADVRGYRGEMSRHGELIIQWTGATQDCIARLDDLTNRLTATETDMRAFFSRDWNRLSTSLDDVADSMRDLGDRMAKLEAGVANVVAMQASQAALITSLDRRVAELERDKAIKSGASSERVRIFTFARAAIVAAAGAIGWLAKHLLG